MFYAPQNALMLLIEKSSSLPTIIGEYQQILIPDYLIINQYEPSETLQTSLRGYTTALNHHRVGNMTLHRQDRL
jgi:hypothetical protein